VPVQDVLACGGGGELVQPCGHGRGEQGAPHLGHIDLGVSGREMPEGSAGLAVAEEVLHRGAVPVPVLRSGSLVRAGHVEVRQDERIGVDRAGGGSLGDRQGALVASGSRERASCEPDQGSDLRSATVTHGAARSLPEMRR